MKTLYFDKEYQKYDEGREIDRAWSMANSKNPKLRKIGEMKLRAWGITGDEKNYGADQGVERGQMDY